MHAPGAIACHKSNVQRLNAVTHILIGIRTYEPWKLLSFWQGYKIDTDFFAALFYGLFLAGDTKYPNTTNYSSLMHLMC